VSDYSQLCIQPVKKAQAPLEIHACFADIQDKMGVPWPPANWRSYAMYPAVILLFWNFLKPMVASELFLRQALAITEYAYREVSGCYQPSYTLADLDPLQRQWIQWELDAFEFGNPQLLIQQVLLSRALRGETGQDGSTEPRHRPSAYRQPEIRMLDEQSVSMELQQVYQDIKQTLGLPVVNSDYQALAKWPEFFIPAWSDAKRWLQQPEYQRLRQQLTEMAEAAADRLQPAMRLTTKDLSDALNSPKDFGNLQQMVQMFTELLPGLILNDALFRIGIAGGQLVAAPPLEGAVAPG